ncbi:transposase [Clostridia bacterium]|nr:transposase [Clostridia bacterium]
MKNTCEEIIVKDKRKRSKKSLSLKNLSLIWLETVETRVKESSHARYRHIVNKYIVPQLGGGTVSGLTEQRVTQFISALLSNGSRHSVCGLSPKTVSDIFIVLKAILKYGVKANGIPALDLSDIMIVKPENTIRIFTREEFSKLNRFLQNDTDNVKLGVLICLYTGVRIGELCAMKWENINVDEGFIQITNTLQRIQAEESSGARTKIIITSPKSSSSLRDIPIPASLLPLLKECPENTDYAYFLTGREDSYMEPRTVQNRFKSYLETLGIEDANFHALRHTFATKCVELGFELKCLSEILGHSNVNITLNKYIHPSFDLKRKNMDKLSALSGSLPQRVNFQNRGSLESELVK